jgi:hypothetical protein
VTGKTKNIALQITQYDGDKESYLAKLDESNNKLLSLEVDDWDKDVDNLLESCTAVREEMIETFDACLGLKPQRKDIITSYMEVTHAHLL